MSRYLYQETCPFCGGRGGTYYTTNSFYCWSCHTYMGNGRKDRRDTLKSSEGLYVPSTTNKFSFKAMMWLTNNGITESMIKRYKIGWHEALHQVILPIIIDNEIVAYEAREFLPEREAAWKYTSRGSKKNKMIVGQGDILVIVEDCLSAYRIAEFTASMPLCGNRMRWEDCIKSCMKYKEIVIWLDGDEGGDDGRRELRSLFDRVMLYLVKHNAWSGFTLPEIRYIITNKDPKGLSNNEIKEQLNNG